MTTTVRRHLLASLPAVALLLGACSDSLVAPAAPRFASASDAVVGTMTCEGNVAQRTISCFEGASANGSLAARGLVAGGERQDNIVGSQGVYVRLTSGAGSYAGEVLSAPVTVQNLTTRQFATANGLTRDDAGVKVYLVAAPVTTGGSGTVTVANATGTATFTATNQSYWQYGGKIGGIDQSELGADGILDSAEVSSARSWQFNLPATVTTFTFQAYVSTSVAGSGSLATVAPQVTAISPATLVPGQSATLTGYNFSVTPAENAVLIGGQPATVTGATATSLTVTVPCTNSGSRAVNVTRATKRGADYLQAVQAPVHALAAGQSVILGSSAASQCNELASAGGTARYVISVVNVSSSTSSSSEFQLSADAAGLAPLAAPAAVRQAPSQRTAPATSSIVDLINEAAQARVDDAHMALLEKNAAFYRANRSRIQAARSSAASRNVVSADPAVTRTFRVADINAPNFCNRYWVVSATRVYWNGKLAIYEDDATDNAFKASLNPTMATYYQQIGDQFNAGMEPVVRNNYGDILRRDAELDNNGIMIALFTPRFALSFGGTAGFVVSCDQLANDDASAPAVGGPYTGTGLYGSSNTGEYFYAMMPTVTGSGFGVAGTADYWYRTIRSTFIHESKHVAAQSARVANGASSYEEGWLEEGMARTSEELWMRNVVDNVAWKANTGYGSSVNPINVYCDVRTSGACVGPHRPAVLMHRHMSTLFTIMGNPGTMSPFGPTPGDPGASFYANSWALIRYALDRYGSSDASFLTALTQATTTGTANLSARAGVSIDQLLAGRALSLYADDYPGLASPSADIQFPTWNLRAIYTGLRTDFGTGSYPNTYALVPSPLSFGSVAALNSGTMYGGSSRWYELSGTQTAAQLIRLQGSGGAALPSNLRIAIARLQ